MFFEKESFRKMLLISNKSNTVVDDNINILIQRYKSFIHIIKVNYSRYSNIKLWKIRWSKFCYTIKEFFVR